MVLSVLRVLSGLIVTQDILVTIVMIVRFILPLRTNVHCVQRLTLECVHVILDTPLSMLMEGLHVNAQLGMDSIGEHTVATNAVPDISKTGLEMMGVHNVQQESIHRLPKVLNVQIVLLVRAIRF